MESFYSSIYDKGYGPLVTPGFAESVRWLALCVAPSARR